MQEQEEVWVKVGKYEHNLPAGKHVLYGNEYVASELTADALKELHYKKCPHVRIAAAKPKTENPAS